MGLGLPSSGGDAGNRVPVLKYDGRAGRLFRVDRSNASGQWETEQVEVTNGFQAIMDLENIETGWLHFPTGGAPDIRTVKIGTPLPERPSDKHRAGFRILMKLGKSIGGDLREMAANAQVSIKGMDALYDLYLAGVQDNPGKLPIVVLEKTIAVTSQGKGADGKPVSSTNYQPVWAITKWVDRPDDLPASGQTVAASPASEQPKQETRPEPALASAGGEEF